MNKINNYNDNWFNKKLSDFMKTNEPLLMIETYKNISTKLKYIYSNDSVYNKFYDKETIKFLSLNINFIAIKEKIRELMKILNILLYIFLSKNKKHVKKFPLTYEGAIILTFLYSDIFTKDIEQKFINIYKIENINLLLEIYDNKYYQNIPKPNSEEEIENIQISEGFINLKNKASELICVFLNIEKKEFHEFIKNK